MDDGQRFQMLLDRRAMKEEFGPLDLQEFAALWNEANSFMESAVAEGFRPEEVPGLYTWLNSFEDSTE